MITVDQVVTVYFVIMTVPKDIMSHNSSEHFLPEKIATLNNLEISLKMNLSGTNYIQITEHDVFFLPLFDLPSIFLIELKALDS